MKKLLSLVLFTQLASLNYAFEYKINFSNNTDTIVTVFDGNSIIEKVNSNTKKELTFNNDGKSVNIKINDITYCKNPQYNPFDVSTALQFGKTSFNARIDGVIKNGALRINCSVL